MKLGEQLYRAQQEAEAAAPEADMSASADDAAGESAPDADDVMDAEFTEIDEDADEDEATKSA